MNLSTQTFRSFCSLSLGALSLSLALGPMATSAAAADPVALPAGDQILRVARSGFVTRALPFGPDRPGFTQFGEEIDELALLPDGRMLAVLGDPPSSQIALYELELSNGTRRQIGIVAPPPESHISESPLDLVADAAGRLYLLTEVLWFSNPPEVGSRLVEIDLDDASTLSSWKLPRHVEAIAVGPQGLWALAGDRVRTLDPVARTLGAPSVAIGPHGAYDMDADSSGALWFWDEGVCSPPCPSFHRLDPFTGAVTSGFGPSDQAVLMQDLVIRRHCTESESALCLQGGRFRAELTWKDFLGQTGVGRVAGGRSADTGLFYFFEKKNWEMMVKVLNGCDINGHFWVYGSASTTVEYSLTLTDLENGAVRTYTNPLGQSAITITDSAAFVCP